MAGRLHGQTEMPATRPAAGIEYRHEVRDNPPLQLHIVRIDLADPTIHLRLVGGGEDPDGDGPWNVTLQTVRKVAQRENFDLAVNAGFFQIMQKEESAGQRPMYFAGTWAKTTGWAMSDGRLWSFKPNAASLVIDQNGQAAIGRISRLPAGARQIISGSHQLVTFGRNTAVAKGTAPRTAAGIDAKGKTLTLLVVDGRQPGYSAGMTLRDLADEMIRLDCFSAINLDGGGSSTLVMRDPDSGELEVINHPSDGSDLPIPLSIERPVATVLGVQRRPPPAAASNVVQPQ